MDGKTYPYLELAALPAVGEALLDPRPAFVFAADGVRILFANAAGAAFFGEARMGDLLAHRIGDLNPLKAQIARLARQLPTETARLEMLRVGNGVALATLPAACRRLNLADGGRAVLVIGATPANGGSLIARAELLVDATGTGDCLAAVLTADGKVIAASGGFDELTPAEPFIDTLVAAAQASGERVVKRPITIGGRERDAGAARFRTDGRDLLLLIVGPAEDRRVPVREPEPATIEPQETPIDVLLPHIDEEPEVLETPIEAMLPHVHEEPVAPRPEPVVRFVFETDADGCFTFVSGELAATVGDRNGAIVGHTFADIADAFGFDASMIAEAIAKGVPFAVTVSWRTDDGETVGVDFTGSPVLSRERKVLGCRGFGTIHPDDRQADTRTEPRSLAAISLPPVASEQDVPPAAVGTDIAGNVAEAPPPNEERDDLDDAARRSIEQGRREGTKAAITESPEEEPPATETTAPSNVVRLPGTPPLRIQPERLTGSERDAFRRIAEALGKRGPDETEIAAEPKPAKPARSGPVKAPATEIDTRLLDRLPVGITIFRDGKHLFANRTLLEFLFYDSFAAFAEAGGAEAIFPGNAGLAGNIAEAGGKLAAVCRDGEPVPVRAWLHAVTFAGSTALMLSLIPDRERSGAASEDELVVELARSEAHAEELEGILDTATDGVIVFDGRGKIGIMNRAAEALFGVEAKNYAGRYFTDLLADESQKAALDYLDGLASNGVASVLNDGREVIGRVPAGGLIPLFMTMGRIGSSDKFCAVLRDITHWKNVEAELIAARRAAETANTQKSDFLAKISHEIRTPLNAIIGFSEVMMGERFGPIGNARYRDYLHDIHVSGAHLMSLINDLLDLSKIEAGKVDLSFEAVPVNPAIQECVALMQPQANRERIIIRTSLSVDVPQVVADPRSLRQILLNLMSNAVKFTRAGGQVIVSSALEETGEVTVRIRDTGIGMSEKDIETALKPFRQVALSRDDREHGTGLGLPLTKAMVEANRATFTIESAPNQGTLVKITFPTTRVLAG
jgi:PAS domain S-box-containing protein